MRFFELLDRLLKTNRLFPAMAIIALFVYVFWIMEATKAPKPVADNETKIAVPDVIVAKPLVNNEVSTKKQNESRGVPENVSMPMNEQQIAVREKMDNELKKLPTSNLSMRTEELDNEFGLLEKAIGKLKLHLSELSLNDSGRKIASDTTNLSSIVAMFELREKQVQEFSVLSDEVKTIQGATKEALSLSKDFEASQGTLKTIQETKGKVQSLRRAIERLELAISTLEANSSKMAPLDKTLLEALKDREKAEAMAVVKAAESAREASLAQKAKAESDRKQAIIDAEKKRMEDEANDIKAKAERASLLADFNRDLPQIKYYLGKLFVVGHTQPKSAHYFEDIGTEGPVSFKRIVATGALADKVEGNGAYSAILHLMNSTSNDRILAAPYPSYIGGSVMTHEAAAARPAYQLLKKYGRLLVEKGYLME
jgi:hypothetical protein